MFLPRKPKRADTPSDGRGVARSAGRYALALGAVVAATLLTFALYEFTSIERGRVPFIFYFGAIIVAARYGGRGPALLSVAASALVADYLFLPPFGFFGFGLVEILQVGLFALVSLLIVFLTERGRRAVAAERRAAESLATTLRSIGDAVIATDAEGRITLMNGVAERLTGWSEAEARGRELSEVFRIVNEETREPVENPAANVLREGRVVGLANYTLLVSKGGEEIPIEDSSAPIFDGEGRLAGVVLVFHDVAERRRAERALLERERELTDFVENAPVGLHWVGEDGTILWANRAELEMLGYTADEYVGRNITEFHADREVISDMLRRLSCHETLVNYEARMLRRDGAVRHVLVSSNVMWDEGGRFLHTRCFTRDVTDRKRSEEAAAQLAAIIESSEDAIIGKTLDGIITSWNAAAERLYGYTAREAIGRHLSFIIPPELSGELEEILGRLRDGGRIQQHETVRLQKGGKRIEVSLTVSPVRDDSGHIVGASTIARDITARKRAEEASRESEARLAGIVDSAMDAIITVDAEQRVVLFNHAAERMFRCTAEKAAGQPLERFIPARFRDEHAQHVRRFGETGVTARAMAGARTVAGLRSDGEEFPLEASISQIESGGQRLYTVIMRDVTERRRAEEELRRRNERLELLSQAASHLLTTDDPEQVVRGLYQRVAEHFGLSAYFNFMIDEGSGGLRLDSCAGIPANVERNLQRIDLGQAVCGTVAQTRERLYVADIQHSDYDKAALVKSFGIRAYACNPLMVGDRLLGTLSFATHQRDHFTEDELEFFSTVCYYVAMAKERLRLLDELKQRANRLAESEEQFRQLADAMPQIVWTARADGYVDYFNRRWIEYTGLSAEETHGWGWQRVVHTDDLERCLRVWSRAVVEGHEYSVEYRFRRAADGQYRWHLGRGVPTRDAAGRVVKWFGTATDIHDQKRGADRLRFLAEAGAVLASSLDYEHTLEQLARLCAPVLGDHCLVDVIDEEGRAERVAVAHVDPAAEGLVEALRDYPPDMNKDIGVPHVLRTGRPVVIHDASDEVLRHLARDERHLAVLHRLGVKSFMTVPLMARDHIVGALTLGSTVEPLKYEAEDLAFAREIASRAALAIDNARLYRETLDANRAKDEFLATLSHELRTPLTPILGWTHMLGGGRLSQPEAGHAVAVIENNAQALTRLINDLLDMSSILSGKMSLDLAPLDLGEAVREAVETVRPQAERRSVRIDVGQAAGSAPRVVVSGDHTRLVQVFWNLLANAVKFSRKGGTVRVEWGAENGDAVVEVADEGLGIAPDFLPHVFDRFRQADGSTTRAHGGLGIGLALVKSFTESHGGRVRAESEGAGRGARFIVSLPLLRETDAAPSNGGKGVGGWEPADEVRPVVARVLVVEDSRDTLDMLHAAFAARGYETILCESGDEALEMAPELRCDIIVSDIGLPRIDGYEMIRRLRGFAHLCDVPAVALTGYASASDAEEALAAGFHLHVPKPVDPGALLEAVETLLAEVRVAN